MLNSLIANNKNTCFFIHILEGGLSAKSKLKYYLFFHKKKIPFKFYNLQVNKFLNAPISGHITYAAYNRIFISSIINNKIDTILYLDCDIIIRKNIDDIYNVDIENYYLAAVREIATEEVNKKLNFHEYTYFNSGVLFINLKKWRQDNLEKKMIDFIEKNSNKITYHDQDTLNYCTKEKWLQMDYKFNTTHFFFHHNNYPPSYFGLNENEYQEILKNAAIIHFTSQQKPWIEGCKHPKKDLYFKYELTFSKLLFGRI